jgi:hypothetical protein
LAAREIAGDESLRNAFHRRDRRLPMSEDDQKRIPFGIRQITNARTCLAKLLPD